METVQSQLETHFRSILKILGQDLQTEGLLNTPKRSALALLELTQGYKMNITHSSIQSGIFKHPGENQSLIEVKDIEFFSLCEHHLLPFFGQVNIRYRPKQKILGLSKFPRIVNMFSQRLQIQERLTNQILEAIVEILEPSGLEVSIQATHLCMSMRGVRQARAITHSQVTWGSLAF